MNKYLLVSCISMLLSLSFSLESFAAPKHAAKGSVYSVVTKAEFDANLPEPFSRVKETQVVLNFDIQMISLILSIDETAGININFPITSDSVDSCGIRTVIATPPAESTPYYKDFEIKVVDASLNKCENVAVQAATTTTLKSFEVRKKVKTFSTMYGDKLKVYVDKYDDGHRD